MSLILEALKKLEREKKAPERGFLVTTRAAWPARGGPRAVPVLVGLGLAAAGALGAWLVLGAARSRPASVAPAAPATPVTTPRPAASVAGPVASPLPLPPLARPSPAPVPVEPPVTRPAPVPSRAAAAARRDEAPPADVPSPGPSADPELRLEAVSQRDGQPVAVLSGRLVHEGDVFDNVRVIRIGESEVEIEVDGRRRVLGF